MLKVTQVKLGHKADSLLERLQLASLNCITVKCDKSIKKNQGNKNHFCNLYASYQPCNLLPKYPFNNSTKMKTSVAARDWALGEETDYKEAQRNFLM